MPIKVIHTFIVHPGKSSTEEPALKGAEVSLDGKLFKLLEGIYSKSDTDCDIEIAFNPGLDGKQANACRDLIVAYLSSPSLETAKAIAVRLEKVTTKRSRLGLLFLIVGKEGAEHKVVISRFPTDSAILAEEDQRKLTVEFLERVFMKSATAYKAVAYSDASLSTGFWQGRATDKQINSSEVNVSNYWISDFLVSDFRTTAAAGTRRLAVSLRAALASTKDVGVKSEIAAAVTLAKSLAGERISIQEFVTRFGLSKKAVQAIVGGMKSPEQITERFQFDAQEFAEQVPFRSVELDNGGVLTAEADKFDIVFKRKELDPTTKKVRFSAEGRIANERLKKSIR